MSTSVDKINRILNMLEQYSSNTSENNVEERLNKCLNLYLSELNYSYRNIISNIDKKSVIKELNKW